MTVLMPIKELELVRTYATGQGKDLGIADDQSDACKSLRQRLAPIKIEDYWSIKFPNLTNDCIDVKTFKEVHSRMFDLEFQYSRTRKDMAEISSR